MNIQEYRYRHTGTAVSRGVAGRRLRAGLAAAVLTLAAGVLTGCSGLLDKVGTDTPSGTYITLSAENGRTVLPVIGAADLTDLVLTGTPSGGSGSTLGSWETYGAMQQASVAVTEGSWAFTLTGKKDGTELCGTLEKTIVKGSNALSFTLEVISYAQTESGTGNVNVTVYYPSGKAGAVTAECINNNTGENAGGTVTYTEGSGVYSGMTGATYTAEGVASGEYELSFTFYCDAAETVLLDDTWNEFVCIADGTTSSAVRVIDSFDDIYTITYNLNGGSWTSGTVYPASFCIKSDVVLPFGDGITRSGYAFNCWYNTDESCTNGIAGWGAGTTTGNVELWAGWTEDTAPSAVTGLTAATAGSKVTLSWTNPADKDLASIVVSWTPVTGTGSTTVTGVTAGAAGTYTVTGLTNGTGYTFTVKAVDSVGNESSGVSLTPHFYELTEIPVTLTAETDGTAGTSGMYIYFGDWPQTIQGSSVTVSTDTTTVNGWTCCYGSDGYYYANVIAAPYPYESGYTFSDGKTITGGSTYYFKVEPIKWRVVTTGYDYDGTAGSSTAALLVAESILTNVCYYGTTSSRSLNNSNIYANNYKYSNIRAYLNGTANQYVTDGGTETSDVDWTDKGFLQTAFTSTAQAKIQTTKVDNSLDQMSYDGTNGTSSAYVCDDTSDKVFLLSEAEAVNTTYYAVYNATGSSAKRMKKVCDYARATGAYMVTSSEDYQYCGWWWLRSPSYGNSLYARGVDRDGYACSYRDVRSTSGGVAPALSLLLE